MSALVLPDPMPVADDKQQLPMFDGENDLAQAIKVQAEANRLLAEAAHALLRRLERQRDGTIGSLRGTTIGSLQQKKRRHQPHDPVLRRWDTFTKELQRIEQTVRRDRQLRPDAVVTKFMIEQAGGPTVKTLTRIMVETYSLLADQWPPSTWPVEPPGDKS